VAGNHLSTPAAIVLAGGLMGLGLFFGLRDRSPGGPAPRPAEPVVASGAHAEAAAPHTAAPPAEPPRPSPPPAPVDRGAMMRAVTQEVTAALDKEREALVAKCWTPNASTKPPPKPAKLAFDFTFDASGRQVARGVQEARGTGSPEITRCVLESLPMITVTPPGAPANASAVLTLP
jgi:hypothetical protein